jgi:indole-3-glycerol phosphate synthase
METNFLARIVEQKRSKLEKKKREYPLLAEQVVRPAAKKPSNQRPFFVTLDRTDRLNFIAEIKRASPSRGLLRGHVDPAELGVAYESHGAAAISVLTEEDYFLGSLEDLKQVKQSVSCPVLRKDFIIDPYQVYEASAAGADAILLIAAILDAASLSQLLTVADRAGLSIVVEVHNQAELEKAVDCRAEIIGINNRDLTTFRVDLQTTLQLAPQVPEKTILVSESGISTADDVRLLREAGVDAFLIGEHLMKSPNPGKTLRELMIRSLN